MHINPGSQGQPSAPPVSIQTIAATYFPQIEPGYTFAMTSRMERAYALWLAKEYYRGQGAIVELGCWLGALSLRLAQGLVENAQAGVQGRHLQVFDLFRWDDIMEDFVRDTPVAGRFKAGDSYAELYRERMAAYADRMQVTQADLTTHSWPGAAIEVLVVDVMKTVPLTRNITNAYFPALIPGRALVAHQDYLHFGHPWIHLATYLLADALSLYHVIPWSSMVVFRVERPIAALPDFPRTPAEFSEELIGEAYAWNRKLMPESVHDRIASAEVHLRLQRHQFDIAERLYWDYTRGPFRDSPAFTNMYRINRRYGYITFTDDRVPPEGA